MSPDSGSPRVSQNWPSLHGGLEIAEMHVGFGRDLQQQRVKRGVELEAIAANTRVSIRYLRALEDERSSDLPGGVFNKGILRSYCQFVGLEEREWLDRFSTSELCVSTEPDWAAFAESVRQHRLSRALPQQRRWFGVLLMLAGLVALAWVAWHFTLRPRLIAQPKAVPASSSRISQTALQRSYCSV